MASARGRKSAEGIPSNNRLLSWLERLSDFDFEVEHCTLDNYMEMQIDSLA